MQEFSKDGDVQETREAQEGSLLEKRRYLDLLEDMRGQSLSRGESAEGASSTVRPCVVLEQELAGMRRAMEDLRQEVDDARSPTLAQAMERMIRRLGKLVHLAGSHEWCSSEAGARGEEKRTQRLEREMHLLEQQALDAIAEAGRLRQRVHEMQSDRSRHATSAVQAVQEHDEIRRRLTREREEKLLLTEALGDSETEIARLAKNIDLLARKVTAA